MNEFLPGSMTELLPSHLAGPRTAWSLPSSSVGQANSLMGPNFSHYNKSPLSSPCPGKALVKDWE